MNGGERIARLRLIRSSGIGPVGWHQSMQRWGSGTEALYQWRHQWRGAVHRRGQVSGPLASEQDIDQEMRRVSEVGARHIFYDEDDYPAYLKQVDVPPPVLIVKGRAEILARPSVAIIGARNASAAACRFARQMAHELSDAGVSVVSGLARGVDTAAHIGALNGGTAAVIGSGMDISFPPENAALQERIGDEHLLISEYPMGTQANARQFPARNRIIAGSTMATLVVEAAPKSGSLITARQAGEFGRDVMAVPGSPMDPRAQGCNRLIQDGANLIQNAEDVLALLRPIDARMTDRRQMFSPTGWAEPKRQAEMDWGAASAKAVGANDMVDTSASPSMAEQITALLGSVAVSMDELVRQSGGDSAVVQSVILDLELAGRIERHAGARVSLIG
ncbi:DNA-processing protein DprA [Sphingopyxis yananensis]|uniref:DNA-processing protein DprA n=1 Tax=Sphingopyxis yananensis TaxID=2886687 RepID=UPI001D10D8E5|nr:DNA-processing protein DprA [Sphingopyxis yananensis]MCC2603588.1 DNA-processing protein DprA [Sphingopyxis yananensis]